MSLTLARSVPINVVIKTYGISSMPDVNLRTGVFDLDIAQSDFCKLITLYLWQDKEVVFSSEGMEFVAKLHENNLMIYKNKKNNDTTNVVVVCVISEDDWRQAVRYYLTNTNLEENDPRISLIESYREKSIPVKGSTRQDLLKYMLSLKSVPGWGLSEATLTRRLS